MRIEEFGVSNECLAELKRTGIEKVEEIVEFLETLKLGDTIETGWKSCTDEILNGIKHVDLWSDKLEQLWPTRFMRIEEFGVSDECLVALKGAGITWVEEIVEFLEGWQLGVMFDAGWLICIDEILVRIKQIGLWSEEFKRKWPSV